MFAILGLIVATVVSTWFFRGFTLALDMFSTILFAISFLGGWFAGLTKANKGLIIGRVSTGALFVYLMLGIVLLPIAVIIYFILVLFFGFLVIPYVAALAGGIVGALGRWFLEGFGEEDEAEEVKYGRFYGLGKVLLILTLIAHFAGIWFGGLPGSKGFSLGSGEQSLKEIPNFSGEKCASIQQGMTVREVEKILNAPPNQLSSVNGQTEYTWEYENAKIVVVTEQKIDEKTLLDEALYLKGTNPNITQEQAMKHFEGKGIFSRDKKIVAVDNCLVCTTEETLGGGSVRSCTAR